MIRKRLKGEIEFELFQQVPLPRSDWDAQRVSLRSQEKGSSTRCAAHEH
jgi:hypothetical protein